MGWNYFCGSILIFYTPVFSQDVFFRLSQHKCNLLKCKGIGILNTLSKNISPHCALAKAKAKKEAREASISQATLVPSCIRTLQCSKTRWTISKLKAVNIRRHPSFSLCQKFDLGANTKSQGWNWLWNLCNICNLDHVFVTCLHLILD